MISNCRSKPPARAMPRAVASIVGACVDNLRVSPHWLLLILVCSYFPLAGAQESGSDSASWKNEPVHPVTTRFNVDPKVAALGEKLFNDARLSRDSDISCASCHLLDDGGDDNRSVSIGTGGARTEFNSPTVFNVGLNFRQFWDGRADTLEMQVDFPLTHPGEMATSWEVVLSRLRGDSQYPQLFTDALGRPVDAAAVRSALADFQRTLMTVDAPFDRWLRGEQDAISEQAKLGYQRFKELGCSSCHQGEGVGGNMFAPLGVIVEGMCADEAVRDADMGRFRITGDERDRCLFKVPSLRNVALTGPYFHDGSVRSLEAAVLLMGHYQLGRRIGGEDSQAIIAFLKTLTGSWKGKPLQEAGSSLTTGSTAETSP